MYTNEKYIFLSSLKSTCNGLLNIQVLHSKLWKKNTTSIEIPALNIIKAILPAKEKSKIFFSHLCKSGRQVNKSHTVKCGRFNPKLS